MNLYSLYGKIGRLSPDKQFTMLFGFGPGFQEDEVKNIG